MRKQACNPPKEQYQPGSGRPRLRTPEVAEYIGCSPSKVTKWRVYGGGPVYSRVGRIVVYSPDDIDRWLAEHRRCSTSDGGK